jgi:hypothetical protein
MQYPTTDQIATADMRVIADMYFNLPSPQCPEEEAIYDAVCRRVVDHFGPNCHLARHLAEKASAIV